MTSLLISTFVLASVCVVIPAFAATTPSLTDPAAGTQASSTHEVTYEISFPRRNEQLVDITMIVHDWKEATLDVHLPVWRPGRYEVLDTAGTLRQVTATDSSGQPLAIEKTHKASWRITRKDGAEIRVHYQVYANALGNRTRHVDNTHAFLSGASVFMYCHERRNAPCLIRIQLPPVEDGAKPWTIGCGLSPFNNEPNTLHAPDYDTLVDSPIEVGINELKVIDVDGVPHEFVTWGRSDLIDQELLDNTAKIIRLQRDFFGRFPYQRYVFLTHISPAASGGTEHLNSTIIQARPSAFDTPKGKRGFLSLISHELFHTWNVKGFRPQGLKPYEYQRENYTTLLWVAEGSTSYYDDLLCARAGAWSADHYLEALSELIDGELKRPGAAVQSLESSGFDAWIKFNRPTPDSVNSTVSFYSKGALVNFMLDSDIRAKTANAKSLDDLMRALNDRFPLSSPKAYSTQDLLDILKELTGADYSPFFADYIAGTRPITIDTLRTSLSTFGLIPSQTSPKTSPGTTDSTSSSSDEAPIKPYLGLDLKDADGQAIVTAVRGDGPCVKAGIFVDDGIIALNGSRFKASDLETRLKQHKPGDTITLTLFNRDQLKEVQITLGSQPAKAFKVERDPNASETQRAVYAQWIGHPWPNKAAKTETLPSN